MGAKHRNLAQLDRRKRFKRGTLNVQGIIYGYHSFVFESFFGDLHRSGWEPTVPAGRGNFWGAVQPGLVKGIDARELLLNYRALCELNLRSILEKRSLSYWLHIYRRLLPSGIHEGMNATTTYAVRAMVESAIKKYGKMFISGDLAYFPDIDIAEIMNGAYLALTPTHLQSNLFRGERELVLKDFGVADLQALLECELLGFEIWKAMAALRTIAKGALLRVTHSDPWFSSESSPELIELLTRLDGRQLKMEQTASGVVFPTGRTSSGLGFAARYNVEQLDVSKLVNKVLAKFDIHIAEGYMANFVWSPFDLHAYHQAHLPFAEAFRQARGIAYDVYLTFIATLLRRRPAVWQQSEAGMIRDFARAYDGPMRFETIVKNVTDCSAIGSECLGTRQLSREEVEACIKAVSLDNEFRNAIDVGLHGPYAVFYPVEPDTYFIDYAWMHHHLYHLFHRVTMENQNFKGDALERLLQREHSPLPTASIKNNDESRQIDAAYEVGSVLLVVEAKAVGISLAYEDGDFVATQFRRKEVVERSLTEAEDKASWLAANPRGANYDITKFSAVHALGVSPFIEHMPELAPRYWLSDETPRVLTPEELNNAIKNKGLESMLLRHPNTILL